MTKRRATRQPKPGEVSRTVKATPDSFDRHPELEQEVNLIAPHPPVREHIIGKDDATSYDNLELTGKNVLDFVKHYSDSDGGRFYFRGGTALQHEAHSKHAA